MIVKLSNHERDVLELKKFTNLKLILSHIFDKTIIRFKHESFEGDPNYDCKIGLCYIVRTYDNGP